MRDYVRHGITWLFAALNNKAGAALGRCDRRHRSRESRRFLDLIEAQVPSDLDVRLILDNYGTHKTPLVRRWLTTRPRLHLHFTPTSASRLKLVEVWLIEIERQQIRRGAHRSVSALELATYEYLTCEDPKPFVWAQTADEIFAGITRF